MNWNEFKLRCEFALLNSWRQIILILGQKNMSNATGANRFRM